MLDLKLINGITATVAASCNCGLSPERVAAKVATKYGIPQDVAAALVNAMLAVGAEKVGA